MDSPSPVNGQSVGSLFRCPWIGHGQSCPWPGSAWAGQGLPTDCPLAVHGLFADWPWIGHGCSWCVHGLSV
eukprot:7673721-Lingulodinium_polyedra.AAC.1